MANEIPKPGNIPTTWSDYFARRIKSDAARPKLEPLSEPCFDCAVTCGLYSEITHALSEEPIEIQNEMASRWFCHNSPNKACRGNLNLLRKLNENSGKKQA